MSVRGFGRLPVVSREDKHKLLGVIRREEIIKAYNVGLARRAELQHRTQRAQLRNIDGTEFVEVALSAGDDAVGKSIQDISLPHDAILVSIRRDGQVLIPHGTTRFETGDLVTAFIHSKDIEALVSGLRQESQLHV
jgi:chloride channel protein, CIC family